LDGSIPTDETMTEREKHPGPRTCCGVRVVRVRLDGAELAPEGGAAVWPIARDGARHEVEVELGR